MNRRLSVLALVVVLAVGLAAGLGVGTAAAADEPQARPREVLVHRPSGFWTSNRPADGGAYRWRLLALGVGIAAVTGYLMVRLIRRADAQRAGR